MTAACASCSAACLDLLFGRLAGDAGQLLRRLDLRVGVTGVEQIVREIGEGLAAGEVLQFGELRRAELALQAGEPAGERGERIGIGATLGDVVEDLLQRLRKAGG